MKSWIAAAACALAFSGSVHADDLNAVETWNCTRIHGGDPIIVVKVIDEDLGAVTAMGVTHAASVVVSGLKKEFSFGVADEQGYQPYMLVIQADGKGFYYEREKANSVGRMAPSMIVECGTA